ncbi:MAG: hypothetical protein QM651_09335 [Rhodoblastus sp.]
MTKTNFARLLAAIAITFAIANFASSAAAAGRQAYVMLSGWGLYPPASRQSPIAGAMSDIAKAHVAGIVYGTLGVPPWIRKNRDVPDAFDPNAYNSQLFSLARSEGATLWLQLRYYDNWVQVNGQGRNITAPEITNDGAMRNAFVAAAMETIGAYAEAFPRDCTIILGEEETPYHARLGGGLFWAGEQLWDQSVKKGPGEHLSPSRTIEENFVRQYASVNSILISAIRKQHASCRIGLHIGHYPLYQKLDGKSEYALALSSMPRIDFTFYDLYQKVSPNEADFVDKLSKRVAILKQMGQNVYYLAQLHTTNAFGHGGGRTPSAAGIDRTVALAERLGVSGLGYYTKNAAPTMCGAGQAANENEPPPTARFTAKCDPTEDGNPLDPNARGQNMVFDGSPARWRYGLGKLQGFLGAR